MLLSLFCKSKAKELLKASEYCHPLETAFINKESNNHVSQRLIKIAFMSLVLRHQHGLGESTSFRIEAFISSLRVKISEEIESKFLRSDSLPSRIPKSTMGVFSIRTTHHQLNRVHFSSRLLPSLLLDLQE